MKVTCDDGNNETGFHAAQNNSDGQNSQLRILYEARGRKIAELQKQAEQREEELLKKNRILQHKLTLTSSK